MTKFTVNSECGLMTIEAANVAAAKEQYEQAKHFDFDGCDAGEYPGSWYWIKDADGVEIDGNTAEMPN